VALDREPIAQAIVARLQAACPLLHLVSRSPIECERARASMHALALVSLGSETAARQRGAPPVWTIEAKVNVLAKNGNASTAPDTQLNALARQVEAAFERQSNEATADQWQTSLGGLVSRCWVTDTHREQGQTESEVVVMLEILAVGP
jgi:hypothetical protein